MYQNAFLSIGGRGRVMTYILGLLSDNRHIVNLDGITFRGIIGCLIVLVVIECAVVIVSVLKEYELATACGIGIDLLDSIAELVYILNNDIVIYLQTFGSNILGYEISIALDIECVVISGVKCLASWSLPTYEGIAVIRMLDKGESCTRVEGITLRSYLDIASPTW